MIIGVDARPLIGPRTGVGNYLYNILSCCTVQHVHKWYLYAHKQFSLTGLEYDWIYRNIAVFPGLRIPGTVCAMVKLPTKLRGDSIEVFWGTVGILPYGVPRKTKTVVTVHDLVWHYFPETMSLFNKLMYKLLGRRGLSRADLIIVPSNTVAREIEREFGVHPDKLMVIYEGVGAEFIPREKQQAQLYVRTKFGVQRQYILAVGTIQPRKNLARLLEAHFCICDATAGAYDLVIVGGRGWKSSGLSERIAASKWGNRIQFLGRVDTKDLPFVYSGCEVFVMPSLYEGFGLPVVEAMACGCPVVVSDRSALSEVVGEAGVLVDPLHVSSIVEGITSALGIHARLGSLGVMRARQFSWEVAARATMESLSQARAS